MEVGWNLCAMALFLIEVYHTLGHLSVLCGFRLLPRKDLVRLRLYFLIDGLSSFGTVFLYTGLLRWLVSLHMIQHLYYFISWEKTPFTKRIVDWSCLDWLQSPKSVGLEVDNLLISLLDIAVHMCNVCMLGSYLSTMQILLLAGLAQITILAVICNPRLAWSSPSSIPAWVQRRISALPSSQDDKTRR